MTWLFELWAEVYTIFETWCYVTYFETFHLTAYHSLTLS